MFTVVIIRTDTFVFLRMCTYVADCECIIDMLCLLLKVMLMKMNKRVSVCMCTCVYVCVFECVC